MTDRSATFRVGLVQMRSGRTPQANLDAAAKLIGEAKDGGADYVQTPEMTNIMEGKREQLFATIVPEEDDAEPRGLPRTRAQAVDLAAHRLAGDQGVAREGRQPLVPDRPEGRDRRALRQDPHVRRRSRQRRELSRIAQLPARRSRGGADLPWGRLGLTICYDLRFPALYRALAEAGASFLAIPRPSPARPAKRTGMC